MPSNRTANAAWPASAHSSRVQANWPKMKASRSLVRFKMKLTEPVALLRGCGTDRAEVLCGLLPAIAHGKPRWPAPCDALGADGWDKVHVAFGHLLKHG